MTAAKAPTPALSLTSAQEGHLRTHLDTELAHLERDGKKHALHSLTSTLDRLSPLLEDILSIPSPPPWGGMRTDYLLNLTPAAVEYITSLPLIPLEGEPGVSDEDAAACAMRCLLDFLALVERGWVAALRGEGWVEGSGPVVVEGGAVPDQTARVRLRSIVSLGREKMLAWARPYGEFHGLVLGPDGVEGEFVPVEEESGWEAEVVHMWERIIAALDALAGDEVGTPYE